jgi:hypothetical protein
MPDYRLYRFQNGHIKQAVALDCVDDAEAVAEAAQMVDGEILELWQGSRMVVRLDPEASGVD